jgi:hypothetical protein
MKAAGMLLPWERISIAKMLRSMKLAEQDINPTTEFVMPRNNYAKRWDAAVAAGQRNIDRRNDFHKEWARTSGWSPTEGVGGPLGFARQCGSNVVQGATDATAGEVNMLGLISKAMGTVSTALGTGLSYVDRGGELSERLRRGGEQWNEAGQRWFDTGERITTLGDKLRTSLYLKTTNDYDKDGVRDANTNQWINGNDPNARWGTTLAASAATAAATPYVKSLWNRPSNGMSVEAGASGVGQYAAPQQRSGMSVGAGASVAGQIGKKTGTATTSSQLKSQGQIHNDIFSRANEWLNSHSYKPPEQK